jgi:hypothetical protein
LVQLQGRRNSGDFLLGARTALLALLAGLSRDSRLGQRNEHALSVEIVDGFVGGLVERIDIGKGLMGEIIGLEVVPNHFDVIEFGRVFGQAVGRS